ncbi:unknown [Tannerella sp. CAG:118]|nr:unknown [Tannerella sp. CAG:118]
MLILHIHSCNNLEKNVSGGSYFSAERNLFVNNNNVLVYPGNLPVLII